MNLSKTLSNMGLKALYIRHDYLLTKILPQWLVNFVSRHISLNLKMRNNNLGKSGGHQENGNFNVLKIMLGAGFLIYILIMRALTINFLLRKYVLIYDRYFYDWIYYLDRGHFLFWVRFIPKPDLVFLLDLEIPKAFSRMRSEEDKLFSTNYYSSLRNWYLNLAVYNGFKVIDSARNFDDVHQIIFECTVAFLKRRGLFA
jgi:hypothetical protein